MHNLVDGVDGIDGAEASSPTDNAQIGGGNQRVVGSVDETDFALFQTQTIEANDDSLDPGEHLSGTDIFPWIRSVVPYRLIRGHLVLWEEITEDIDLNVVG